MANRTKQISRFTLFTGLAALLLVALLTIGPLVSLGVKADSAGRLSSVDWSAIRFTVFQASLSAALSVGLAIPVARALARRQFFGRGALVTLLGAPFLLPVIVAVLGLLSIWGRSGLVSNLLLNAGAERISIYGLSGILLAHVFFNLPLVTRLLLQAWGRIPAEHFRLAAQLGMRPSDIWNQLEKPMLRSVLPGAFLLVFLLCVTSFAVALALGGGPKATTIELAIYQALRFDFDLGKAALLGLVQFAICSIIAFWSIRTAIHANFGGGIANVAKRWDLSSPWLVWQDRIIVVSVAVFLGTPLIAIAVRGLPALGNLPDSVWSAMGHSLVVAFTSALFAVSMALALAMLIEGLRTTHPKSSTLAEGLGLLTLAISPFVLGTGLFIIIRPIADPFALALPVTALVNASISLPLALRALLPALRQNREVYGHLSDSLGITGFSKFRMVIWPALRKPLGFSTGLAAALSMGDLGVITLFAPPNVETLPLLMYRLMGAYRMDEAATVALLLVVLTLTIFWAIDRGGRLGHNAR